MAPADDRDADAQELLRTVRAEGAGDSAAEAEAVRARRLAALAKTVNPAHDLRKNEFDGADVRALGDGGAAGDSGGGRAGAGGSSGGVPAVGGAGDAGTGAGGNRAAGCNGSYGSVDWTDTLKRPGEARMNRQRFRQAIQPYLLHSERIMAHVAAAAGEDGSGGGGSGGGSLSANGQGGSSGAKGVGGGEEAGAAGKAADEAAALRARKRALEESIAEPDLEPTERTQFQPRPQVSRSPGARARDASAAAGAGGAPGANGCAAAGCVGPRPVGVEEEEAARNALLESQAAFGEPPDILPQMSPAVARAVLGAIEWDDEEENAPPCGSASQGVDGRPNGKAGRAAQLASLPEQLRLPEQQARVHELLRHFWGCLNPRTDATEDKLQRLRAPLRKAYDELHALRAALPADERKPQVAAAITPLIAMIERTFAVAPAPTS